ncbi:hypothetical protein [Roseibaca calidilacus]|uniref:Sulfotransferase family protein n=1 Tax=Roseibaca calidilacus TaxID=1666912 RepID=A0ABP2BSL5_9RHOB|nr:hypothetical protein [Roseibaca calidilacus]CUX80308.1 hypothetical protein Ga0058931_1017 [Roseibaca calidilacus]
MSLSIHVGAHKTATSHLQHGFSKARGILRQKGVAYFGPELLRGKLRLPALGGSGTKPPTDLLAAFARNRMCRLVLSEENILGTTRADLVAKGARFYPAAAPRLTRLLESLGCDDATVYLSIRAPLSFLNSAHGQQQNAGRFTSIDDYLAQVRTDALRWSELVQRLGAVPGVARVVVWRYEDYPAIVPTLLDTMLGCGRRFELPERKRLVGTSLRALEHAREVLANDPACNVTEVIKEARALYPKSDAFPGPAPFDPAALETDLDRYHEDCARLATMAKVTFLRLPEAGTGEDASKHA